MILMRLPKHRLFDFNAPGKGVEKDEPPKKGIALFWDILLRRFWKLVSLNALYILFSVPGLIIGWFFTAFMTTNVLALFGVDLTKMLSEADASVAISQLCMYLTCVIYALFGGGAPTAGMTYVIKSYRVDNHAWVWADFWSTFKEKFVKGTIVYVVDMVLLFLLSLNFCFYGSSASTDIISYLLQGLMVVIFLIFLLMHAYIYPIMISCHMKVWDIYKNSFILAVGKLPVTVFSMALCSAICLLITFLAYTVAVYFMLLIPIILFAFTSYVNLFITYPVIQKYILSQKKAD